MTESERLLMTLGFEKRTERGSVLETFFPWDKTVNNWCKQGLPEKFAAKYLPEVSSAAGRVNKYSAFGMLSRVYLTYGHKKYKLDNNFNKHRNRSR